jgi:hypothetical protein
LGLAGGRHAKISAKRRCCIETITEPELQPNGVCFSSPLRDIDYPGGFYREQAPIHLKYVCTLNGVRSPVLDRPFNYCEIGCGQGETTLTLAASNPMGRFLGIDLSPSHIQHAAGLAAASGLPNVEFLTADITLLDPTPLPDYDFITLHGLYSWVPEHVQAAIRAFLVNKLKPGGIAYLSYNAMPGWGSASPLRRFFIDQARRTDGDILDQSRRTVAQLEALRNSDAPFFRENPAAAGILSRLRSADPRYVAHEYLGSHWQPRYFADVYDEMATQGLEYVGEGGIIENLLEHSVMPEFVERLRRETDRRNRESLRDFIQNRFFRRDIYMRPAPERYDTAAGTLLQDTLFGLVANPIQIPDTINLIDAPSLHFEGAWFERIKQLLAYRVMTLSEIMADFRLSACSPADLVGGIKLLTVGGVCAPFATREVIPPRGPSETIRVVPKLNQIRLQRYDWSEPTFTLASPVMGSGVSLNSLEAALLDALQRPNPVPWAWSELRRRGINLLPTGADTPVEGDEQGRRALQEALDRFIEHKLPKLAYLGVVEPARPD